MERLSRRDFFKLATVGAVVKNSELQPNKDGLYYVDGAITGKNEVSIRWLIDTGATGVAIPPELAYEAEIPVINGLTTITGVDNKTNPVGYCTIPKVWADGWTPRENIPAYVLNIDVIGKRTGVLGANFLPSPECLKR